MKPKKTISRLWSPLRATGNWLFEAARHRPAFGHCLQWIKPSSLKFPAVFLHVLLAVFSWGPASVVFNFDPRYLDVTPARRKINGFPLNFRMKLFVLLAGYKWWWKARPQTPNNSNWTCSSSSSCASMETWPCAPWTFFGRLAYRDAYAERWRALRWWIWLPVPAFFVHTDSVTNMIKLGWMTLWDIQSSHATIASTTWKCSCNML